MNMWTEEEVMVLVSALNTVMAEYKEKITALESEIERLRLNQWIPLDNGWYDTIEIDGELIAIRDRNADGAKSYLVTSMPKNLRLCRQSKP